MTISHQATPKGTRISITIGLVNGMIETNSNRHWVHVDH